MMRKRKIEYIIYSGEKTNFSIFIMRIEKQMAEGWKPIGGVSSMWIPAQGNGKGYGLDLAGREVYSQALVRRESIKNYLLRLIKNV